VKEDAMRTRLMIMGIVLAVGDHLLLPGMGPRIRELQADRHVVAGDQETGTWCLALYPAGQRGE
jgi:hypothetical protein